MLETICNRKDVPGGALHQYASEYKFATEVLQYGILVEQINDLYRYTKLADLTHEDLQALQKNLHG